MIADGCGKWGGVEDIADACKLASFAHYPSMFCECPLWVMAKYKLFVIFQFVVCATEYICIGWH